MSTSLAELKNATCRPLKGAENGLSIEEVKDRVGLLTGWALSDDGKTISRDFKFKDFYRTMSFVNAVAHLANSQDHHPDMEVGYGHCLLRFITHDVGGLSENDFIVAAKVEDLFD